MKSIKFVFRVALGALVIVALFSSVQAKEQSLSHADIIAKNIATASNDQQLSATRDILEDFSALFGEGMKSALNNTLFQEKIRAELLKHSTPDRLVPMFTAQLARLADAKKGVAGVHEKLQSAIGVKAEDANGGISGRVTVDGEAPAEDVLVIAFDKYGYFGGEAIAPSGDGTYTINGLASGSYYVVTWSRYYVDEIYDNVLAPLTSLEAWRQATMVPVSMETITNDIDFDLVSGSIVKGTVYREDGTTRLQDETIEIVVTKADVPSSVLTRTLLTTDGRYEIVVPYKGDVRIGVKADGYYLTWHQNQKEWIDGQVVTIPDYESTLSGIDFQLLLNPEEQQLGSISGTVKAEGQFLPPFMSLVMAFNLADSSFANMGLGLLGSYSITDLPAGEYLLYGNDYLGNFLGTGNYLGEFYDGVHSPDEATPVTVTASENTGGINFVLDPGGSISGRVTDSEGNPIDSLLIIAFDAELGGPGKDPFLTRLQIAGANTDENGEYRIEGLPTGEYILRTVSDLALNLQELDIADGKHKGQVVDEYYKGVANIFLIDQATPVPVTVPDETQNINFELSSANYFTGSITDAVSGEPVTDLMLVAVNDTSGYPYLPFAEIDSVGDYKLGPLPAGKYKLLALVGLDKNIPYLSEFYDSSRSFATAQVLELTGGEYPDVNFTLDRGATIQGFVELSEGYHVGVDTLGDFPVVVLDAETGEMVNFTMVQFSGGFRMSRLLPGTYKVMSLPIYPPFAVTYWGGGNDFADSESQMVTLDYGEKAEANIVLEKATGSISGRVYNAETLQALSNIMVIAYDQTGHAAGIGMTNVDLETGQSIDADGTFVISGLRTGNYYLRTFSLTSAIGILESATDLMDIGDTFDNPFEILGGGFGAFSFNADTYKDVWFQNIPAVIKVDLSDLIFKMSSYGTPKDYENSLTPLFVPLPFAARVPSGAIPVVVTDGMQTLGINIALVPGRMKDLITEVENESELSVPTKFVVQQNYPNPFNPSTTISFALPSSSHVEVQVLDILGRHITTLISETMSAGQHSIVWHGNDAQGQPVSAGIYMARVKIGDYTQTIKMLYVK